MRRIAPARLVLVALALAGLLGLAAGPTSATDPPTVPGARGCPVFPATNVWNREITTLPVRWNSSTLIRSIGLEAGLHADFGSYLGYGIPYNVVGSSTPKVRVGFWWPDESDAGPYPIPSSPKIEGGSDRHLLVVDRDACRLYELYHAVRGTNGWTAGSGAIWNLGSNALRPNGWTSADAAGLPILPGLVRYDEVAAGRIAHALRFTAPRTRDRHVYPARHHAGEGDDPALPPMGIRVRLKASFSLSGFSPQARVILVALKRYGMLLADNGSSWYVTGVSDARWNDDVLHQLSRVTGRDLEVVDTSGFVNGS